MKALNLQSCLAPQIQSFIRLRQLSGTDYQSQAQMLGYFDRFLVEKKLREPCVTAKITEDYQHTLSHLTPRVQSNRLCVVRHCVRTSHEPIRSRCARASKTDHPKRLINPISTARPR